MTGPLPLWARTVADLQFDPRPAARHQLRAEDFPRRPSDLEDPMPDGLPDTPAPQEYDPVRDGGAHHHGRDLLAGHTPAQDALSWPRLVACPTCGTGVDPDRLRG